MQISTIKKLTVKAKALRAAVKSEGAAATAARVAKEKRSVLLPLQAAMAAVAPELKYLSEEETKAAVIQPQLLSNHLFELEEALEKKSFDAYVSKTTGDTYPGGKVERELEEVGETADEFLDYAAKYLKGKIEAGPFVGLK